jgi:hypothetical protein
MFNPLIVKKILAIGLGIIVMGYSITGFAQRRNDARKYRVPRSKFVIKHPVPHYGKVVVTAPVGYRTIWAGGVEYLYHGGAYYRKRPSGFVVVRAPIGAIIATLPIGFITFAVGSSAYYYYGGVYYQRIPSGYVVVEAPPEAVVVEEPPVVVSGSVSVTTPALNVRSGPGKEFRVIGQVSQGDVLVIRGNAPEWLYVQFHSGKFGWVLERFTTPLSSPARRWTCPNYGRYFRDTTLSTSSLG